MPLSGRFPLGKGAGRHIEIVVAKEWRFRDVIFIDFYYKIAHDIPIQPTSIKIPRRCPPLISRRCGSKMGRVGLWEGVVRVEEIVFTMWKEDG